MLGALRRPAVTPAELIRNVLRGANDVVAVTGATGWLGSVAVDLLYQALGDDAPARVAAYASTAREIVVSDGRTVPVRPLTELSSQTPAPTTLLHFAFLTRDRLAGIGIDSYTRQNVAITAAVVDAIATHRPRRVVVASSGAVHASSGGPVSDLAADPYGTLKHLDELALRTATSDVSGVCVIPRIFSVAGRGMARPELYALGHLVTMAATGGPIDVRAQGPVVRSYCGADEVVALALWVAFAGQSTVFDTCGDPVEMGDLARLIAQVHGLGPDVVRRNWDPDAVADRYVGEGQRMQELAAAARLSLRSLEDLVRETSAGVVGARPEARGTR